MKVVASVSGLPDGTTLYALRHSSVTRALKRGVPTRIVAAAHDTSVAMIEQTYSAYILDHSDALTRAAMFDPSAPPADNVVSLPSGRCA
jgi:hypothetical protein